MTVQQVKAKLPLADIYELKPDCQYVIVADPSKVDRSALENLVVETGESAAWPPNILLIAENGALEIFELKREEIAKLA